MTLIALVLLLALSLALLAFWQHRQISVLHAQIKRLELENKVRVDIIVSQGRLIEFWRNEATGGAFAEFINSLDLSRLEHRRKS